MLNDIKCQNFYSCRLVHGIHYFSKRPNSICMQILKCIQTYTESKMTMVQCFESNLIVLQFPTIYMITSMRIQKSFCRSFSTCWQGDAALSVEVFVRQSCCNSQPVDHLPGTIYPSSSFNGLLSPFDVVPNYEVSQNYALNPIPCIHLTAFSEIFISITVYTN